MKSMWLLLGRITYWLCWPLLHAYLRVGKRTRVLVLAEDKVLVVKGWLSAGTWSLPGGGLHFGEEPVDGAVRELQEETGITLKPSQLQYQGKRRGINDQKHRYTYHWFVVKLPQPIEPRHQRGELTDAQWVHYKELLQDERLGKVGREIIRSWYDLP